MRGLGRSSISDGEKRSPVTFVKPKPLTIHRAPTDTHVENDQASTADLLMAGLRYCVGMTDKKSRTKRQTHRKRSSKEEVRYVVEIQGWDWGFWFGITNAPHLSGGHYDDYRHLEITGTFVAPPKYAGRTVELAFLPDKRLNNQGGGTYHINSIGHLTLPRSARAICSMPSDSLPAVLQMLIAERFRFVVFSGAAARYGQVDFRSFRFATTFDSQEDG
jgi:hypothetical protein